MKPSSRWEFLYYFCFFWKHPSNLRDFNDLLLWVPSFRCFNWSQLEYLRFLLISKIISSCFMQVLCFLFWLIAVVFSLYGLFLSFLGYWCRLVPSPAIYKGLTSKTEQMCWQFMLSLWCFHVNFFRHSSVEWSQLHFNLCLFWHYSDFSQYLYGTLLVNLSVVFLL